MFILALLGLAQKRWQVSTQNTDVHQVFLRDFALALLNGNAKDFLQKFSIAATFELELMDLSPTHWIIDDGRQNDLWYVKTQTPCANQVGVIMNKTTLSHIKT